MRTLIQRVLKASVSVEGKEISSIGKGICVFVGIETKDSQVDAKWLAKKILDLRLWPDDKGSAWKKGAKALGYDVLLVSQFTLYAKLNGNKPDYHTAMSPMEAKEFYSNFVDLVGTTYGDASKVHDGLFGAKMLVDIENDGTVTIMLDSLDHRIQQEKTAELKRQKMERIKQKNQQKQQQENDKSGQN